MHLKSRIQLVISDVLIILQKYENNALSYFYYILNVLFKVLKILFKEKLSELSGNAQRSLFQVIGRMIDMGIS
jgi:hypothetical protein